MRRLLEKIRLRCLCWSNSLSWLGIRVKRKPPPNSGALSKAFKTYYNVRDPQVIQDRATAELPLEQVYRDWPVSMNPEVHIKAVTELFQSGATIVNIHSGQTDQKRVIDFYGKNVLPKLKLPAAA